MNKIKEFWNWYLDEIETRGLGALPFVLALIFLVLIIFIGSAILFVNYPITLFIFIISIFVYVGYQYYIYTNGKKGKKKPSFYDNDH